MLLTHNTHTTVKLSRKTSYIRRPQNQNLNDSRLIMQLPLPTPLRPGVENEDVVGAAPTGDAPTTSEWSTISLPSKERLISETWRYIIFGLFPDYRIMNIGCWLLINPPHQNFLGRCYLRTNLLQWLHFQVRTIDHIRNIHKFLNISCYRILNPKRT